MMQADLFDHAAERLANQRARLTPTRRRVLETLEQSRGPLTVSELQATLRDVPTSSLYRALTSLQQAGLVICLRDTDGTGRYELAEWITGHHHHITCSVCGSAEDIDIPEPLESAIATLLDDVARGSGFRITGHRLELEGVCRSCQRR
jgi:Fe2+ or Zn2+ uptake regulation protein